MGYLKPIKKWRAKHDRVVMLHIAGDSNEEIAAKVDYSVVRVSQILQDPKAEAIIAKSQRIFRARMTNDITERMLDLAEVSSKRVAETMTERFDPGTRAKHHQDKIGLEILKGTGFLGKNRDESEEPPERFSPKLVEKLVGALEKSNEVALLMGTPITPHEEVFPSDDSVSND